jgi:CheY-like chemotaxis protein
MKYHRALIVDDSVVQRNHAVALCRALGMETVYAASNGREAIALLAGLTPSPDLLILDLEMPTMDGAQMLQQLKEHGIDVPILVASSRELPLLQLVREMGSALGLSMVGTMQKPLTFSAPRWRWPRSSVSTPLPKAWRRSKTGRCCKISAAESRRDT